MPEHGSDDRPELLPDVAANATGGRRRRGGNGGKPPHTTPKSPRATQAEIYERVTVVMGLIVAGVCRERSILRALATLEADGKVGWRVRPKDEPADPTDGSTVSRRTVQAYIAKALAELRETADEHRSIAKAKARARYERALEGAVAASEWDVVRRINRDLVRLDGLEPGMRVTVDGQINNTHEGTLEVSHTATSTIEDRSRAVVELLSRAGARRDHAARQAAAALN